jgi:hypothetical protein
MDTQFGRSYARSVASDFRVPGLGTTVEEAIADGVDPKAIWRAVCDAFDLPSTVR